mmetsp:Transcript_34625/g.89796  ORF Transcript_34625/g.89796 Transcript_34625/m.89796 type:complete len:145 (+) Transcript_34625:773-1207(+)
MWSAVCRAYHWKISKILIELLVMKNSCKKHLFFLCVCVYIYIYSACTLLLCIFERTYTLLFVYILTQHQNEGNVGYCLLPQHHHPPNNTSTKANVPALLFLSFSFSILLLTLAVLDEQGWVPACLTLIWPAATRVEVAHHSPSL